MNDRPEFARVRHRCYKSGVRERAVELYDSITPRERLLMERAWQCGRDTALDKLYDALGLGATFERDALLRWMEKATEYSVQLDDQDVASIAAATADMEMGDWSEWGPVV